MIVAGKTLNLAKTGKQQKGTIPMVYCPQKGEKGMHVV